MGFIRGEGFTVPPALRAFASSSSTASGSSPWSLCLGCAVGAIDLQGLFLGII